MLIMTGPSDWSVKYTGECKKTSNQSYAPAIVATCVQSNIWQQNLEHTRINCTVSLLLMHTGRSTPTFKDTRLAVCNPHTIE